MFLTVASHSLFCIVKLSIMESSTAVVTIQPGRRPGKRVTFAAEPQVRIFERDVGRVLQVLQDYPWGHSSSVSTPVEASSPGGSAAPAENTVLAQLAAGETPSCGETRAKLGARVSLVIDCSAEDENEVVRRHARMCARVEADRHFGLHARRGEMTPVERHNAAVSILAQKDIPYTCHLVWYKGRFREVFKEAFATEFCEYVAQALAL